MFQKSGERSVVCPGWCPSCHATNSLKSIDDGSNKKHSHMINLQSNYISSQSLSVQTDLLVTTSSQMAGGSSSKSGQRCCQLSTSLIADCNMSPPLPANVITSSAKRFLMASIKKSQLNNLGLWKTQVNGVAKQQSCSSTSLPITGFIFKFKSEIPWIFSKYVGKYFLSQEQQLLFRVILVGASSTMPIPFHHYFGLYTITHIVYVSIYNIFVFLWFCSFYTPPSHSERRIMWQTMSWCYWLVGYVHG